MKQFHCPICGKSFGENYTLKRHLKGHGELEETTEATAGTEGGTTAVVSPVTDTLADIVPEASDATNGGSEEGV